MGILVWGYYYNKSQESAQHEETIITEGADGFNQQAVTITNYAKDWSDSYATISFKNNTNHEITNIEFRMVYYDMNGKMLDYRDFNEKVKIDSGMVRQIKILGYKEMTITRTTKVNHLIRSLKNTNINSS